MTLLVEVRRFKGMKVGNTNKFVPSMTVTFELIILFAVLDREAVTTAIVTT